MKDMHSMKCIIVPPLHNFEVMTFSTGNVEDI